METVVLTFLKTSQLVKTSRVRPVRRLRYFVLLCTCTHARTETQTRMSSKHTSELELPKQTSHGSHAWLGAAAGTLRPRVLRWANGVWVAITQSATHGDCHGTAVEWCKATVQAHSLSNLRESKGGKRWETLRGAIWVIWNPVTWSLKESRQ